MIEVPPDTILVFADLLCPFAHVAIHRLWETRQRLGLDGTVAFDLRAFPLELFNGPGSRIVTDSETPVLGRLEPDAGWQLWSSPDWQYPNTVLLAFEAVHAAREQGQRASEVLDRALRRAFWADSRCIGHYDVILDVARAAGLDVRQLGTALAEGRARPAVFADYRVACSDLVAGSPHLFLPDGTSYLNPGMRVRWQGNQARGGFPIVEADDRSVYEQIMRTAHPAPADPQMRRPV